MKRLGRVLEIKDGDVAAGACDRLRNPDGGRVSVFGGVASAGVLINVEDFGISEKGASGGVVF